MTQTTAHTPAKRGDLAILVTTRRDFYIGEGTRESTTVEVCEVTNITRDGIAKRVRPAQWDTPIDLAHYGHRHQVYIVPAAQIDVAAALKLAAEHPWPSGHKGMPYASLDEVKAMLRPLRKP
jgi:hypothetical protein